MGTAGSEKPMNSNITLILEPIDFFKKGFRKNRMCLNLGTIIPTTLWFWDLNINHCEIGNCNFGIGFKHKKILN